MPLNPEKSGKLRLFLLLFQGGRKYMEDVFSVAYQQTEGKL